MSWVVTAPTVIASGRIASAVAGECLAGLPNAAKTATIAQIQACGKTAGQTWTLYQNGTVHLGALCLTAATPAGGPVTPVLSGCLNSPAQLWQQAAGGGLANLATSTGAGKCLTDPGSAKAAGTPVTLAGCVGSGTSQGWNLPVGQLAFGLAGQCLLAKPGKVNAGICAVGAGQGWSVTSDGLIKAVGQCLRATGAALGPGTPVTLAACGNTPAQHWQLLPFGWGTLIANPASGLCLTVPTARPSAVTRLALGYCGNANPRQAWRTI